MLWLNQWLNHSKKRNSFKVAKTWYMFEPCKASWNRYLHLNEETAIWPGNKTMNRKLVLAPKFGHQNKYKLKRLMPVVF